MRGELSPTISRRNCDITMNNFSDDCSLMGSIIVYRTLRPRNEVDDPSQPTLIDKYLINDTSMIHL